MQVATRSTVRTVPGIAGVGSVWDDIQKLVNPLIGAAAMRIQTQPGATIQYGPDGKPLTISQQTGGYPILMGTVSGTANASPGAGTLIVLGGVALVAVYLLARR